MTYSNRVPPFDAMLRSWSVLSLGGDRERLNVLVGIVLADRKGRFRDGAKIRTSPLQTALERVRSGAVVSTANSRYLLLPLACLSDREMFEELCCPSAAAELFQVYNGERDDALPTEEASCWTRERG
jgi:hypothetical protein